METKENLNIVILDRIALGEDMDLSRLNEFGKVTIYQTTEPAQVIERLKDADVVLTNKVTINKEIMDALPKLKYIGENATGTNNIDLSYAAKRNIAVTNVKSYSTDSVVQHTFALLFYVYEKLRFYDDYVKDLRLDYLSRNNEVVGYISLNEAFPISVSKGSVSYDDGGYMTTSVTFTYLYQTNRDYSSNMLYNIVNNLTNGSVGNLLNVATSAIDTYLPSKTSVSNYIKNLV